jgi:hypothetical protein
VALTQQRLSTDIVDAGANRGVEEDCGIVSASPSVLFATASNVFEGSINLLERWEIVLYWSVYTAEVPIVH